MFGIIQNEMVQDNRKELGGGGKNVFKKGEIGQFLFIHLYKIEMMVDKE
jgi:hypothetical protein